MQIILNQSDLTNAVLGFVNDFFTVPEGASVIVEVGEDSTAVVFINEDTQEQEPGSPAPTTERQPKKTRRTKAQIEADNKAEAERLAQAQLEAAGGNETPSETGSADPVKQPEPAQVVDAGETTPEASAPGEVEPVVEELAEVPAEEPEVEQEPETPVAEEPETPKPKASLFANLRKPNNAAS